MRVALSLATRGVIHLDTVEMMDFAKVKFYAEEIARLEQQRRNR